MRDKTVDALKGYAIILVVLGHVIEYIVDENNSKIFECIYSFHMPLFMFLSGYIISGKVTTPWGHWLRTRAVRLLIPFFVWLLIWSILNKINFFNFSFLNGLSGLDGLTFPSITPWFLMVLFILYCILLSIKYFEKYLGYFSYIWIFLFLLLFPVYNLWLSYLRWYYIFFFAGYLMARYHDLLPRIGIKEKLLFCGLFLICFSQLPYQPYSNDILTTSPVKWIFNLIIASLGIAASYSLVSLFSGKWVFRMFSFLGLYTLDIYVMHPVLLRIGERIYSILFAGSGFQFYPALLFITIFTLIFALGLSWVIRRSGTIKFILFGIRDRQV
jgi:fucose 4-O-acetylase-like acetyltransferase